MEEVLSQFTGSATVVYLLEWLKKAGWMPFITKDSHQLNRLLAILGSGVAAVGIHVAFSSEEGKMVITGLTAANIAHGAWHWVQQYALTQFAYDAAVAPKKGSPTL